MKLFSSKKRERNQILKFEKSRPNWKKNGFYTSKTNKREDIFIPKFRELKGD